MARVTLMTDASVCGSTGAGGYGFWVVSNVRKGIPGGGHFKGKTKDSYQGEFKAVINAMVKAINLGGIEPGDDVLIQLDNQAVIRCIEGETHPRDDIKPMLDKFKCIVKEHFLSIRTRHVKAHTNRKDSRYIANKMCDIRAKENMRKHRKKLEGLNK